ncbi:MAG: hypothetical protein LZF60_70029 [Nitrospira sp.]|nr:MAG: hypothetical protein LZF60_70029 [Nitrospira sp.]
MAVMTNPLAVKERLASYGITLQGCACVCRLCLSVGYGGEQDHQHQSVEQQAWVHGVCPLDERLQGSMPRQYQERNAIDRPTFSPLRTSNAASTSPPSTALV